MKKLFVYLFILLFGCQCFAATENLDELDARKARYGTAVWGYQYLEDPATYIWQPETVIYTDVTTGHQVVILARQPDHEDIYSKEHGVNAWSADGARIGFFDRGTRNTANPDLTNSRDCMAWTVYADGTVLRASEGGGKYAFPFGGFGWAKTEPNVYYSFGSHATIDYDFPLLCRNTLDDSGKASTVVVLDTSSVNTYSKFLVKDGISSNDTSFVYRDTTSHATGSACESMPCTEIYYTDNDSDLAVDYHWGCSRSITGFTSDGDHDYTTAEDHFHDVWAPGFQTHIMGDYAGDSSIFAVFAVHGSCASDAGPEYAEWDGDSWGDLNEIAVVSDGGESIANPYGLPYFGHPCFDRWGRYILLGTYTDFPQAGTRIVDTTNWSFIDSYPLAYGYDGQHHSWAGWTDLVVGVDPSDMIIYANKFTGDHTDKIGVANTHHPGVMVDNYAGYPRPAQSPDGTKVAFAAFWLNHDDDNYPYINWAVAEYPHPPEILSVSSGTVRFGWNLGTSPRGYTTRGWPIEGTDNPPPPRETKYFRLWKSPDGINGWKPFGTVQAEIFSRYNFATGVWTGNDYWEITDPAPSGYYAVTSVEWSGLESRVLSNIVAADGTQLSEYPADPGGDADFTTAYNPVIHHHYNIYAADGEIPAAVQQRLIASDARNTKSYLDWLGNPDGSTRYVVTAVDTQGNESSPLTKVSVTQPGPSGHYLITWDVGSGSIIGGNSQLTNIGTGASHVVFRGFTFDIDHDGYPDSIMFGSFNSNYFITEDSNSYNILIYGQLFEIPK